MRGGDQAGLLLSLIDLLGEFPESICDLQSAELQRFTCPRFINYLSSVYEELVGVLDLG